MSASLPALLSFCPLLSLDSCLVDDGVSSPLPLAPRLVVAHGSQFPGLHSHLWPDVAPICTTEEHSEPREPALSSISLSGVLQEPLPLLQTLTESRAGIALRLSYGLREQNPAWHLASLTFTLNLFTVKLCE